MQKRVLIYIMLFTFGMLIVPKTFLHDCVRQHEHISLAVDTDHQHPEKQVHHSHSQDHISSSDDCPICDFHFFPFGIHQFKILIQVDQPVYEAKRWLEASAEFSHPKHLLRGPPTLQV